MPASLLTRLEKAVKAITLLRVTQPERAEKLRKAVAVVMLYYMQPDKRKKQRYLSRDVRFQGIWRGWREAGLEHLSDEALTRFCGFPKASVYELAELVAKDPSMAALCPGSKWWRRTDPRSRPVCDVLDATVLVLRELTTVGHQHQLCSDMGIPTGSITKYLATAKAALLRVVKAHPAARVGFFEDQQMGYAAHRALEEQHYKCPVMGVWYAFSIDGTITQIFAPEDPEMALIYFAGSKHVNGVNTVILVSPLGLIHAFRLCLPGNVPDGRASQPIFEWLFDPDVNPNNFGVLVDYGFTQFCHSRKDMPPVARPFQPKKDKLPANRAAWPARRWAWRWTVRAPWPP